MSQQVQVNKNSQGAKVRKMRRAEELDIITADLLYKARRASHRARVLTQEAEAFLHEH